VLIAALALFATGAALAGEAGKPGFADFLKIRTPASCNLLPDGSMLALDRPDGIVQLYRFVPKTPGGSLKPGDATRIQLTNYPDGVGSYSVSRDGKRAIVHHAWGGNENTQLTLIDLTAPAGSNMSPILENPKVQAQVNLWLRDDSGILYTANDESPNDFYVYRYDFATKKATKLVAKEGSWGAADMTKDASRALIVHSLSASNTECYELDVATGKLTDITLRPKDGTASCELVGYMPDEKSVMALSDFKDGRNRLYVCDLKSGKVTEPLPALRAYDLDGAGPNELRDMLAVVANKDGYAVPFMYSLPGFKPLALPKMEPGVLGIVSFTGHTMVWTQSNARTPGLSYVSVYDSPTAEPQTHQLTWAEDQGIDITSFPLPELIKYTAFDGREIPGFLYLPPGAKKGTPIPFVVVYHGGPEGQSRPSFSATYQYYLTRGYGLLFPNVRGSVGYGREFEMADNYKNRWSSVKDGVDAAEWLVKNGYATPGRIATFGGSYGGFMSVACIVEDQERVERGERKERLFGACVDIVGIVNMKSFLEKTSGYRRKLREVEYGPLTDPEFLASISSIHKVEKMQVPFFIAHGFNDPRVPVEEALQIAIALKDRGLKPRVFVAPDEGHGFAKLDNRIYFYERTAQFLDETIGAAAGAAATATSSTPTN
jgi:dipeptidyl aminopeptidase/acylaminoacyl peptidase